VASTNHGLHLGLKNHGKAHSIHWFIIIILEESGETKQFYEEQDLFFILEESWNYSMTIWVKTPVQAPRQRAV